MSLVEAPGVTTPLETEIRDWFERRGANATLRLEADRAFPHDFAEFAASAKLLSRSLVPATHEGQEGWAPARTARTSAALAGRGFTEWLMWHVSSLAAVPVWMSANEPLQRTYRDGFAAGCFGAFAMSERAAGADWRSTRSLVRPVGTGFVAHAQKDYSGNAQSSELVTTFARLDDGDRQSYMFFRADSRRRGYLLDRNVVPDQMYVAQFRLDGYTFGDDDVITSGDQAFADAVNTLNVGKFNLATASVAMARRALAETYQHVSAKELFGARVVEFGQVARGLDDAAVRVLMLGAFNDAVVASLERASEDDDSYRLMTSVAKSLVTQDAVRVVRDLGDIISAKAFESESMFRVMAQYIEWLPRLEGTRYMNLMQSIRAAQAFFAHLRAPEARSHVAPSTRATGVSHLLSHRPLGGLESTSFTHLGACVVRADVDSVATFRALVDAVAELFVQAPPRSRGNEAAVEALGDLFTRSYFGLVVLQELARRRTSDDVLSRVGDVLVGDLLAAALSARRVVDVPPEVLKVLGSVAETPGPRRSGASLDLVHAACGEFLL